MVRFPEGGVGLFEFKIATALHPAAPRRLKLSPVWSMREASRASGTEATSLGVPSKLASATVGVVES